MTDDPTTKPCPSKFWHHPEVVAQGEPCCVCGGTGRVPMDTGELLEALFALGWDVKIYRTAYGVRVVLLRNGSDYFTPSGKFNTPAEALRAAIRAVTP